MPEWLGAMVPPGSIERGMYARVPQEPWEISPFPPLGVAVSRNEGNEVKRNGRREVRASHCTVKMGEPTQGTPWREGDAGIRNRLEERWQRYRALITSQRNSNE